MVPDTLIHSPEFAVSIAVGAAAAVFIATRIGMPISTTHSLVGALFGTGVMAMGWSFNFEKLGDTFLMPLIVSPLMAALASLIAYLIFKKIRHASGISKETCICAGNEYQSVMEIVTGDKKTIQHAKMEKTVKIAKEKDCMEIYQGGFFGINAQNLLDFAHYMSAGVVSYARGLNDTPKIMGLLLVIQVFNIEWGLVLIAIAMAIGGLLNSRKVGETVSKKITPMNHGQGFTANLITSLLVTTASVHGMPVSTTHVSVGSLFGIGTVTKQINKKVLLEILLAWVLTLPVAAIISGGLYWIIS